MIVTFHSSETGELITFAEVAHVLLKVIGKECTARGTFTVDEMLPAAAALRRAVEHGEGRSPAEDDETVPESERPIALGRRAWPFIDMLERTARGGKRSHILWEAAKDF